MFMDENAPPTYFGINNHRNRNSSQNKPYILFDIKKNRFYNSSMNKNKINSSIEKKRNKYKINEEKKEQYKTQIAINTKNLELLEHKYLVELIQLIEYTCNLSLNDYRYADKTYGIFKIIKNKEKKGYDIIINNNNDKKLQKKEEYKRVEIEDEKFDDNEEEEEEEEDADNNSMKGKIKNENYFNKESPKKSIINFKTINFTSKEKKNNIIYNNDQKNKKIDINQAYNNFRENPNLFNEINTNNKTPYFNNPPPMPNIININDSQSEDEYDEEEEEEEKENKEKKIRKIYRIMLNVLIVIWFTLQKSK